MTFVPSHRRPTPPGEMLIEEFLKPMGITQSAFARHIGVSYHRLNEIVHGKRVITTDTAMRFARALGTDDATWMNLQLAVDLYDARNSPEAKRIAQIKPIAC